MIKIETFTDIICEDFGRIDGILEEDQKLPPRDKLAEVCEILLDVSCMREEGRFPSFRVCFISPKSQLLEAYIYARVFYFTEPLELTIQELHKLAPAINGNNSQLMIDISESPFKIVGILMSHTSLNSSEFEGLVGNRMPKIPNIAVKDAGKLEFCFGEKPIVCYNAGRCNHFRIDTFVSTYVADQLRDGSEISDENRLKLLYRLIKEIESYKHGGQLFIVPENGSYENVIDIKYKIPAQFLPMNEDCVQSFSEAARLKSISAYADMIAKLSCVDGGVVLNKNLDLIGFGGEVLVDQASTSQPQMCFVSYDDSIDSSKRFNDNGMRHRACYRFCDLVEDSVAIVFSQDGSIKACTKKDGQVYVYFDVALPVV